MKVGDLVNAIWDNASLPSDGCKEIHLCVYLGTRPIRARNNPRGDGYHSLLSSGRVIEIPSWYWKLEVISESR